MRNKILKHTILLGLVSTGFNSFCYAADDINGNNNNGNVTVNSGEIYGQVSGFYEYKNAEANAKDIEIMGGGIQLM